MRGSLLLSFAALGLASTAAAQSSWVPGSEIVGQSATVETDGVRNMVYLDAGGAARIVSPAGTTVPATWSATGGQLCLNASGASECWPYQTPFRAGQTVTLTSNCNVTSRWMANAVNPSQETYSPVERG